jgi:MFS family permease
MTTLYAAYGFACALQGIIILPFEAQRLWPERSSVALGAFAVLVGVSQLAGPLAGHRSDTWRSQMGRRRPVLLITVAWVSSLTFGLWLLSRLRWRWLFLGVFFLQQVTWTAIYSAQQGLVPDCVPVTQQAFAGGSGAANMLAGALVAFLTVLVTSTLDFHINYGISALLPVLCCMVVCVAAREKPFLCAVGATPASWLQGLVGHYTFDTRKYKDFFLLMVTKTLYNAGAAIKVFLLYFCQDTFRLPTADEQSLTAMVALSAEATAALAAVVTMWLLSEGHTTQTDESDACDGPRPRSLRALVFGALWMGIFWYGPVFVGYKVQQEFPDAGFPAAQAWSSFMLAGTAFWGLGQGMYLAGDQALSFALLPDANEAARYLGLFGLCTMIGFAGGGLAGGVLLMALGAGAGPGVGYTFPGYAAIFTLASFFCLAIAVIACGIKVPQSGDAVSVGKAKTYGATATA